jgi:glycosyltransferase involved in cell wall biosynthesis
MWTLNSEKTLPYTLTSIEKAVPKRNVNQKIIIDGHSKDGTKKIGKKFGWKVIDAEKVGIPYQANQALGIATTEFCASFEHDIILSPNWFPAILKHLQSDPKVAVAQGVRVPTNPILKKMEEASLKKDIRYTSIDNTLYRTEVIRSLGGFDVNFPLSCDRNLQDKVWEAGYNWIVDRTVVSEHIKDSIRWYARRNYVHTVSSDYPVPSFSFVLLRFLFSPVRGFEISLKNNCPQAVIVYPYLRFMWLKAISKRLQNKNKQQRTLSRREENN